MLGTRDSPELLEKLFMDKLPSDVRRIVVASRVENLDDIAERADRILAEDTSSIRTVNSRNRTQSESPDLTLHKKVDSLAESFNQIALAQESIFRTPNPCHTHSLMATPTIVLAPYSVLHLACHPQTYR